MQAGLVDILVNRIMDNRVRKAMDNHLCRVSKAAITDPETRTATMGLLQRQDGGHELRRNSFKKSENQLHIKRWRKAQEGI